MTQSQKDYYQTLGINKNATPDQIKQAYRKLAREHHPDMAKGDKASAEKKFKEVNEAYQVLSDPQKKQMYDQYGHTNNAGFNPGAQGAGGFGGFQGGQWGPFSYSYSNAGGAQGQGFDPMDVFEEFFGFRGGAGHRRGKSLHYQMEISFVEAVKGTEKRVKVESGELVVKVPAGVYTGLEMKFAGRGMPGPYGAPSGDLFLTFNVANPKNFERAQENLGMYLELDAIDAILGTAVDVPVVDTNSSSGLSNVQMKIPSGTQHGTKIRLKGHGMPRVNGGGAGDVIVQVALVVSKKLNKKQKELLEEYKRLA